jgi:hypothetical protein
MKSLHTIKPPEPPIPTSIQNVMAFLERPNNTYMSSNGRERLWFRYIGGELYFRWWNENTPPSLEGMVGWGNLEASYCSSYENDFMREDPRPIYDPRYLLEVVP